MATPGTAEPTAGAATAFHSVFVGASALRLRSVQPASGEHQKAPA